MLNKLLWSLYWISSVYILVWLLLNGLNPFGVIAVDLFLIIMYLCEYAMLDEWEEYNEARELK